MKITVIDRATGEEVRKKLEAELDKDYCVICIDIEAHAFIVTNIWSELEYNILIDHTKYEIRIDPDGKDM
jgi:hypothetical protein